MTRKMAYIGTSFFIGLFFASFFSFEISFIAAAVSLAAGVVFAFLLKKKPSVPVCIFAASAALLWYGFYGSFIYSDIVSQSGKELELVGTVQDISDYSDDISVYRISTHVNGHSCEINAYADSGISVGDNVCVSGIAEIPKNSYTFPAEDYYRAKGVFLKIGNAKLKYISSGFSLRALAKTCRDYIGKKIDGILPNNEGAFLKALIFGDKSGVGADTLTSFNRSGIRHITAVSGFHLALITSMIVFLLRPLKIGKLSCFVIAECFMLAFAALAGFSPSVVRSAVMLTIVFAGELICRRADVFSSLGIALIFLTVSMPFAVRDASLVLSAAGIFGIGVVAPRMLDGVKLPKLVKTAAAAGICSLTVFPFSLLFFDEVSLISPFSNVIIVPLCSAAIVIGVIASIFIAVPFISIPLYILSGVICRVAIALSGFFSEIPFASMPLGYGYITVIAVFFTFAAVITYIFFRSRRLCAIITVSAFATLLFCGITNSIITADNLTIASFDGNYSSVVVRDGGYTAVIAKGGRNQTDAVKKYLVSLGVKKIDVLILTENIPHFAASYNDGLSLFDVGGIYTFGSVGISGNTSVLGIYPEIAGGDRIKVNLGNSEIIIENDNVYVSRGSFSAVCTESGCFEEREYTAVINYSQQPCAAFCGYMLDGREDLAGYVVTADKNLNVKAEMIENGFRE